MTRENTARPRLLLAASLASLGLIVGAACASNPPADDSNNQSANQAGTTDSTGNGTNTDNSGGTTSGSNSNNASTTGSGTGTGTGNDSANGAAAVDSNSGSSGNSNAGTGSTTGSNLGNPLGSANGEAACILPPEIKTDVLKSAGKELLVAGADAPDFTVTDLVSGKEIKLADLRGKFVVLSFWHSTCLFCQRTARNFVRPLFDAVGKGADAKAVVISVGLPGQNESAEAQRSYAAVNQFEWFVVHDEKNDVKNKYFLRGVPAIFVIDPNGKIVTLGNPEYFEDDATDEWADQLKQFLVQECTTAH